MKTAALVIFLVMYLLMIVKSSHRTWFALGAAILFMVVGVLSPGEARVTVWEGKYHQVKRMFAALGYKVTALERVRIGGLFLDRSLKKGDIRPLTEEEAALVFADPPTDN